MGKHTQAFLALYGKLVGNICSDLHFVATIKKSNELLSYPVIDITEYKDKIIICKWITSI